jgi:hypothetical protein
MRSSSKPRRRGLAYPHRDLRGFHGALNWIWFSLHIASDQEVARRRREVTSLRIS